MHDFQRFPRRWDLVLVDVKVSSANTVSVDVQLSLTIVPGPFQRCIEFEFFADCTSEPKVFRTEMNFDLPFDLPNTLKNVFFKISSNKYLCVTARDPLHTLRAVADLEIVGDHRHARLHGDPRLGGNWLIGENVNMGRAIDLLDLAHVRAHIGERLTPSTNCARSDVHADINGDGWLNMDDIYGPVVNASPRSKRRDTGR